MKLSQRLLLVPDRLAKMTFWIFAFNELLLLVSCRLAKMTFWIFGCFGGFEAFEAFGSLGVFGPDQLLLFVLSRLINSTEALRKRFVHLNRNLGAGNICS